MGKLDSFELAELRKELNSRLYETAGEVCQYVKDRFLVEYTAEGMCDLLNRIGFVYKKTKQIPMKVDEVAQTAFIVQFQQMQAAKDEAEVHYFIDAVHPSLNSETGYGWIEKGAEHQVFSNSGRTRMKLLGALNLNDIVDLITKEDNTIESQSATDFIEEIGRRNPTAKKIQIISYCK